jgi:hypothetical protein
MASPNSTQNVLARAISRLGASTPQGDMFQWQQPEEGAPGWSVTTTPHDNPGEYAYPSAADLAKSLLSLDDNKPHPAIHYLARLPPPESGWTDEDIKKLGRDPHPFELSEAGKARDSHIEDQKLLAAALLANEQRRKAPISQPTARAQQAMLAAAQDRAAKEGRRYGDSGWGALQNREYIVGKAVLGGQTFGDAAYSQFFDIDPVKGKDGETGYHHPTLGWVADSSWNPFTPNNKHMQTPLGAALTVAAFPGGTVMKYLNHYLPRAADRADVLAAANKVERILPAGTDRAEGNRLIEQTAKAAEPNFDDLYREQFGEWPSYALSSAATFGNGLIDPTLVATGPAAKVAAMVGKGLQAASKSAAAPMIRRLMNAYGTSMLNHAGPLAQYPILHAAAKEAWEELPFNAGLMTALGPGAEVGQMEYGHGTAREIPNHPGVYTRPHMPGTGPGNASIWGGGENRTDLMREVKDSSGNVIGYGHESDEDFKRRLAENRAQGAALRQGTQGLLQQIENSKTPRRPINPVIMSVAQPPF